MNIGKKKVKIKAVVDTNIFISSFVYPSGIVRNVINGMLKGMYDIGISRCILEEFSGVLKTKFKWPPGLIDAVIAFIETHTTLVFPEEKVNAPISDKSDNIVIECALAFGADYIITGDKELQRLHKYRKIRIISPADFIRLWPGL